MIVELDRKINRQMKTEPGSTALLDVYYAITRAIIGQLNPLNAHLDDIDQP